jgi:peptidyl-dipeptidase Dcp
VQNASSSPRLSRRQRFASCVLLALAVGGLGAPADAAPAEAARAAPADPPFELLTTAWPGPYGGLPPFDRATPASIEAAFRKAVELKRAEVQAIAANPESPTFANTVAALDASGVALARVERLLQAYTSTASNEEIHAVGTRVFPLASALEDEIAFDPALFARVDALFKTLPDSAPTPEARRLVAVTHRNLERRGAGLDAAKQAQLKSINARLAGLIAQFGKNLAREEESLVIFVDDEAELTGLGADRRAAAKDAARARKQPGRWAIPMQRPAVWPVLTQAESRALRERVFKLWESRGNNRGEFDNAPLMAEILKLRGEKARIMRYPTYAHLATADRMAGTPEVAQSMLDRAWQRLLPKTQEEIAALQAIADAEGDGLRIERWDRLYYAEKLRQRKFGFDADAVRPYLTLQNVMGGMMWAAETTFGLSFKELSGIPVVAPDIRVYEVSRGGGVVGVLYVDMFQRQGKGPASWAAEYRTAQRGPVDVLPVVALHSNVVRPADGSQPQLAWEVANVIFHEFGHALHMLSNGARYRALGTLTVPWDFIEAPSLLNERWLPDRQLLAQFARHYQTGAPMPADLVDKLERALKHDRVFSVNLDYLATAQVDMRVHRMADGRTIDPVAEEHRLLAELAIPSAVAPLLRVSHAYHTFTEAYGAGVYTYLWSDAIAADIAEAFLSAPGGLYDPHVAARYRRTMLDAGNTRPIHEAFREFRGRDPDPDALFRRFDLLQPAGSTRSNLPSPSSVNR